MSETILATIIGVVATIVGAFIGSIATYLVARGQWEKDKEAQRSALIDLILTDLKDALSSTAVKFAHDKDYIRELEIKSISRIRFLGMKGGAEKKVDLGKVASELHTLMREYFQKLEQYRTGKVTRVDIDAYRNNIREQVGDILGNI